MLRVSVHGATGKIGKHIVKMIEQDPTLILNGCYSRSTQTDLNIFCKNTDIIIDFSLAPSVDALLSAALDNHVALVIGTTGLSDSTYEAIKKAAVSLPILYAANMSYGINVVNKLLRLACKLLSHTDYDVNILDKHHKFKQDSPSGTALMLSNIVKHEWSNANYDLSLDKKNINDFGHIWHSSVKLGNIVGEHQVCFANLDEQITISHVAENKNIFAKGAIAAAKWLYNKPAGLYSMADII